MAAVTPQAWIALVALVLATGSSIVSIAVYANRTRAMIDATTADLGKTDHSVRNLNTWRLALPSQLDASYARKDTIEVELRAIRETLARIEKAQEAQT